MVKRISSYTVLRVFIANQTLKAWFSYAVPFLFWFSLMLYGIGVLMSMILTLAWGDSLPTHIHFIDIFLLAFLAPIAGLIFAACYRLLFPKTGFLNVLDKNREGIIVFKRGGGS
ncbi:hypothetical protein MOTE_10310 [Moorella thermoacetica]|uniref:Uncharacterized protein n=1 Tax=Neomoorella thermoacetica TaxID=1525 RepID=A0A1J5NVJ0_NEOTH|nr:hypothetical protein MOTE_10310 [Moorella thermoacetica]